MNFEQTIGAMTGFFYQFNAQQLEIFIHQHGLNLTADQFRIMTILWQNNALTQTDLARIARQDRAGITRIIDILEKKGFVQWATDFTDRRINLTQLTELGQQAQAQGQTCSNQLTAMYNQLLTESEMNQLLTLLNKMKKALE